MLANSLNKTVEELKALKTAAASADVPWSGRLLMLVLNFIPMIHAVSVVLAIALPYANLPLRAGICLTILYLLPPLLTRLVLSIFVVPEGRINVGERPFFAWWTSFQFQVIFCRLPALEEILRLIPGLYSQWLRLWGAHIGRFTYWSAGTLITDRSFISIGDDVVFGAGVRLNPHVLDKNKDGEKVLLLATIKIGDRVMVGGYSLLTAGTKVCSDEVTRAFLVSPPFSVWKEGKRTRKQNE
jgi:acetyltransferase-like isoleucine patch superfamily enzyme